MINSIICNSSEFLIFTFFCTIEFFMISLRSNCYPTRLANTLTSFPAAWKILNNRVTTQLSGNFCPRDHQAASQTFPRTPTTWFWMMHDSSSRASGAWTATPAAATLSICWWETCTKLHAARRRELKCAFLRGWKSLRHKSWHSVFPCRGDVPCPACVSTLWTTYVKHE